MSDAPLVSVIVAAHNVERYIARAVNSVLTQTMQEFELVVVDDGSMDGTWEVLQGFNDSRVVRARFSQNRGASEARNEAIARSRGTWLAVLDADDVYAPNRLSALLAVALEAGELGLITDILTPVRDGDLAATMRSVAPADASTHPSIRRIEAGEVIARNIPVQPLFSRSLLTQSNARYDPRFKVSNDLDFLVSLLNVEGAFVARLEASHYFYEVRAGSLTDSPQKRLQRDESYRMLQARTGLLPELEAAVALAVERHQQHNLLQDVLAKLRRGRLIGAAHKLIARPHLVGLVIRAARRSMRYRLTAGKVNSGGRRSSSAG